MRLMPELRKMSPWSPWPISWPASHGRCCPAEKTTGQTATWPQHRELVRKRRLRLGALTRSHFIALRRRLEPYSRGLHRNSKDERTVTTACLETCWTCWFATTDRLMRTDPRATHPGQEPYPPLKAEYICADLSSRPQLFPCSRTADHTYSDMW